ncbi:MAG: hypothetical protein KDK78_07490 [Chlamydiia bacterium]|nr:hypothetical protein [Chlamydiia bacterium]
MHTTPSPSWPTILPFTALLFSVCVAYCVLHNLREAVTLSYHVGADVIPFIKVWTLLPGAVALTSLFAWLSRHLGRDRTFYVLMGLFLCYYLAFAFILSPHHEATRLTHLGAWLSYHLPEGCRGLASMVEHWNASLYYVMCELWATGVIAMLFWGFTNDVMAKGEAEASYGYIKIGGTVSALAGGQLAGLATVSDYIEWLPFGQSAWDQTLDLATIEVVLLGLSAMGLYAYLSKRHTPVDRAKASKPHLSLGDSLRVVRDSPYLLSMLSLVVGYNLVFSLSDVLWKHYVREAFHGDPTQIIHYMNQVLSWVGVVSLLAALSSAWIVRHFGWRSLAMSTPVVLLLTGIPFFACWIWQDKAFLGLEPLSCLVAIGALQCALGKAAKYSVFDVSKEMAYTPLDSETKWKGKAAIDGIGNDLGKTGCSLAQQGFMLAFGSLAASTGCIAVVYFLFIGVWIAGVRTIADTYEKRPALNPL